MTSRCIDCAALNLKGSPLGRHGFGICKASREPWRMPSVHFPRECARFTQAPAETVDEELTISDACIKFGVTRRSMASRLWELRQRGIVETVTVIRRPKGIE